MHTLTILLLLIGIFAPGSMAWAHGTVGDYTFLEPIVAEDANPKNEFDIVRPQWTRTTEGRFRPFYRRARPFTAAWRKQVTR